MRLLIVTLLCTLIAPVFGASAFKIGGTKIVPTHDGVAYGEHKDHKLDLWIAESKQATPVVIYIHGGGFFSGSRGGAVPFLLFQKCLDAGISCVSLDYRLSGVEKYPAQMHDCARALQFLRANAEQYNLDPRRFATTGGSAGAGISQWLAYHDDLAQPQSSDPILRQSSRVRCTLPYYAQCSYDPRVIKNEILPGGTAYNHPALKQLHGLSETIDWETQDISPELDAALKDCSPVTHLSADDAPVWMMNMKKADNPSNIHSPGFGRYLEPLMKKHNIPFEFYLDSDFKSGEDQVDSMMVFINKYLIE
jgi:acetyl esterase/lipase